MVDIGLVKEFYKSLELVSNGQDITVSFQMGKEQFQFTEKDLAIILDIECEGYDDLYGGIPMEATEAEVQETVMGDGEHMSVTTRVLHEYLALSLVPRGGKHTVPTTHEVVLLWKILKKAPVNLPRLILHLMVVVKKTQTKKLPYPRLVKQVLLHFDVYHPKTEVCCSRQLDEGHMGRMNYTWTTKTGWIHKYESLPKEPVPVVRLDDDSPVVQKPAEDTGAVSQRTEIISLLRSLNDKMAQLLAAQSARHAP